MIVFTQASGNGKVSPDRLAKVTLVISEVSDVIAEPLPNPESYCVTWTVDSRSWGHQQEADAGLWQGGSFVFGDIEGSHQLFSFNTHPLPPPKLSKEDLKIGEQNQWQHQCFCCKTWNWLIKMSAFSFSLSLPHLCLHYIIFSCESRSWLLNYLRHTFSLALTQTLQPGRSLLNT